MIVKQRSGLIPITTPNWKSNVGVDYEFKTTVAASQNGTEQRRALRQTPRVSYEFSTILTEAGVHRHMADLAASQDSLFTVPTPWRWTRIAGITGAVVTLAEVPFWVQAGVRLILESATQQEIVTVASVSGSDVTLSAEPGYSFAANDRLWHAGLARAQDKVTLAAQTNTVFDGQVSFALDPGADPLVLPTLARSMHEGKDILAIRPNWQSAPRFEIATSRDLVDFGRGVIGDYNALPYHSRTLRLGYTFTDPRAAEEFLAFFCLCQGKRASFWMPTWTADLTTTNTVARNIEVAGTDIYDAYNGSPVYNAIYWAGQVNRVSSMEVINSGADTRLVMADSWSNTIPAGTRLSWCPLWRWATDKLTFEWETNGVAEVSTAFQTLPNEAP